MEVTVEAVCVTKIVEADCTTVDVEFWVEAGRVCVAYVPSLVAMSV